MWSYLVSSPFTVVHGQGERWVDAPHGLHFVVPLSWDSRVNMVTFNRYKRNSRNWTTFSLQSEKKDCQTHHFFLHVGRVRYSDPAGGFLSSQHCPCVPLLHVASWKQDLKRAHSAFGWKFHLVLTEPVKCLKNHNILKPYGGILLICTSLDIRRAFWTHL